MDVGLAVSAELVLCINSGSSSLKFALFAMSDGAERKVTSGNLEDIGSDHAGALDRVLAQVTEQRAGEITVVGHRVVHGGPHHVEPALVDDALLASLHAVTPLAPLHMPAAIAGIEAVRARHPQLPQVACFDTAFHATMPEVARRLPIPEHFIGEGLRRYGFHGLSYEYVMSVLGDARPARIVIAHLGSGASLVAVADGRAIDTTMGLTPAGGVIMGTRTGDLDPGVLLYLAREHGLDAAALEKLVNHECGLVAIGGTSDMKTLLERARSSDTHARQAIAMFGYSVRKAIGALAAALGGIDLLVFTGGIGEHAPEVRAEACLSLEGLGIAIDHDQNARGDDTISTPASRCAVRVIPTDEDLVIARHSQRVRVHTGSGSISRS